MVAESQAMRWAVRLPAPTDEASSALVDVLSNRRTIREISADELPEEVLSDLLWAAWGVNRKAGPFGLPGRTAGSASNSQEINLYVALDDGVYIYDAAEHSLEPVVSGDLRKAAMTPGQKDISPLAPVHLIYVADIDRLIHTSGYNEPGLHDPETQKAYYHVDAGMIAENVYLFAAANGLAAWFHNCDRETLAARLQLTREQRVLFAQSVGYPRERGSKGSA